MAGVKGMRGSGGARPGSGRKPKPKAKPEPKAQVPTEEDAGTKGGAPVAVERDMLKLLQDIALGIVPAEPIQVRAAIAAVQYTHMKKGDGGKKEEQADKAKKAGQGRFKAAPTPLKLVGGR